MVEFTMSVGSEEVVQGVARRVVTGQSGRGPNYYHQIDAVSDSETTTHGPSHTVQRGGGWNVWTMVGAELGFPTLPQPYWSQPCQCRATL